MIVSFFGSLNIHTHHPVKTLVMGLLLTALTVLTAVHYPLATAGLTAVSVIAFATCFWAAHQLLGSRSAELFFCLAWVVGWFAEQMGSAQGWFFGRYSYTDVLGFQLGNVPLVIPLMWFVLCFVAYVMASLLLWRQPVHVNPGPGSAVLTAWLAAMIVTAFDLGADPYFVFVLKAWVMEKADGGWFGETLQGFVGWMVVACAIVVAFQWWAAPRTPAPLNARTRSATGILLLTYASGLVFQMLFGHPVEIRAIAFFAMGLPLLVACAAWWQWQTVPEGAPK